MDTALYIMLLGGRPHGRNIEQHDIYFGIGDSLKSQVPGIKAFWPEAAHNLHIDGYMRVEQVGHYKVLLSTGEVPTGSPHLFFINLGGYKSGIFEELHKKILLVAEDMADALRQVKKDSFFRETEDVGNKGKPHVDDKFEVALELDDVLDLTELSRAQGQPFTLEKTDHYSMPEVVLGYFKLSAL